MEKVKLPALKFILRQWSPGTEVPFRKAVVIEAIKNLPDLETHVDNRDWDEIEEEMLEEQSRIKDEEKRQRKDKERQELNTWMKKIEDDFDGKLAKVEQDFSDELTLTSKRIEKLEKIVENKMTFSENHAVLKIGAMPTFDGKGSVDVFLQQVSLAAQIGKWSDATTAGHLVMHLRGTASLILKGLTTAELGDLNKVQSRLRQRFSESHGGELSRIQFHNCTQDRKETVREFAQRLESLSLNAYTGIDENLRSSMIRTQFVAGIFDSKVRMKLSTAEIVLELPETVAKAELLHEINRNNVRKVLAVKSSEDVKQVDADRMQMIDRGNQSLNSHLRRSYSPYRRYSNSEQISPSTFPKRDILCYNCNESGHIARYCPLKRGEKERRNNYSNVRRVNFPDRLNQPNRSYSDSENYQPARTRGDPGRSKYKFPLLLEKSYVPVPV